jgi:hypothetical protein
MMRPDAWQAEAKQRQALSRELRRFVSICHPDKWHGHSGVEVAEELTKAVLTLRERLEATL